MSPIFAAGVEIGNLPMKPGQDLQTAFPDVAMLINVILRNSITIISLILLVLLISGGMMYIIGAGNDDPKAAQKGQQIITDAAIGFAVVFLSYFIVQIVQIITGLNILNPGI